MLAYKTPLDVKLALHNYNRKYRFIPIPKGGQVSSARQPIRKPHSLVVANEEPLILKRPIFSFAQPILYSANQENMSTGRKACLT